MKRLEEYFFDDFVPWLDTKPFYVLLLTVALPVLLIGFAAMALGFPFGDDNGPGETKPRVERVHVKRPPPSCFDIDSLVQQVLEQGKDYLPATAPTTILVPTTTTCAQK